MAGRGASPGGQHHRIQAAEHEGVATAIEWPVGDPSAVLFRPVAFGDTADRRDKSGQWSRWYRDAIPQAEELYAEYLKERERDVADEQR